MGVVLLIPGVPFGSLRLAKLHPRLENSAASLLPNVAIYTRTLPSNPSPIATHTLRMHSSQLAPRSWSCLPRVMTSGMTGTQLL